MSWLELKTPCGLRLRLKVLWGAKFQSLLRITPHVFTETPCTCSEGVEACVRTLISMLLTWISIVGKQSSLEQWMAMRMYISQSLETSILAAFYKVISLTEWSFSEVSVLEKGPMKCLFSTLKPKPGRRFSMKATPFPAVELVTRLPSDLTLRMEIPCTFLEVKMTRITN